MINTAQFKIIKLIKEGIHKSQKVIISLNSIKTVIKNSIQKNNHKGNTKVIYQQTNRNQQEMNHHKKERMLCLGIKYVLKIFQKISNQEILIIIEMKGRLQIKEKALREIQTILINCCRNINNNLQINIRVLNYRKYKTRLLQIQNI